jgi:hypothetical protein
MLSCQRKLASRSSADFLDEFYWLFGCHLAQKAASEGIRFIDSTPIIVCHPKQIRSHKVFKGIVRSEKRPKDGFLDIKLIHDIPYPEFALFILMLIDFWFA